ncbi:MAG TPA: tRNA (adenosine(37)-N6)-threonylcarbamoyltransferase complex dimerization subunit type 1 TsaB [Tepidisphaeraceae bacterium]|jgi:tRNA threonylcarbamoyladenosine biosynthesis protein TsaB|nr:tRNA (adenosine(37)-N6)-threonylcarbamoyltransferase complex dimerization subunit type 1 TsaB [Tepidisphaeraceae bacterium]
MPRALAIETSGRVGSVALVDEDGAVEEGEFPHGLQHAAGLIPLIDKLCSARGWTAGDLEEVYVSAGPGSFTGLRIGITLAKTLAFATGVRLVAAPTMRVLVENAPGEARQAIIVLDAKREQIFTARFERVEGRWVEREGAHLDSLVAMLERAHRPVYLMGEGIAFHRKYIPADDAGIVVTAGEMWRARAGVLARIGGEMARAGEFVDPYRLEPIYIRAPEAQEKMEAKEQKSGTRDKGQGTRAPSP